MGWWRAGEDGSSLHAEETGLIWGDGPADIVDDALDKIAAAFRKAHGRQPTRREMGSGLLFSLHLEGIGLDWGSGPADVMDGALEKIVQEFLEAYGRKPTRAEVGSGLLFSLGRCDEDEAWD